MRTSIVITKNIVKARLYRLKYRVMNTNGFSDYSDIVYIRAGVAPGRPQSPQLVSATATKINLKLFKPTDNGGSEITKYELYRNDGNDANEPTTKVTSYLGALLTHELDKTADSLVTGKIYKIKFRAINVLGNSEDSGVVRYALVDKPLMPSAPTVIYASSNETQIAVEWAAIVPSQTPGQEVYGYVLEVMDTSNTLGQFEVVFDGSVGFPSSRSYVYADNRVKAGHNYLFRVKASFRNGLTAYSATSLPVYACSPPSYLLAPLLNNVNKDQITLEWSQPRQGGACPLLGYQLYMNNGAGGDTFTEIDSAAVKDKPALALHSTTSATTLGATYRFKLKAYNVVGSTYSESVGYVIADLPTAPASAPATDPSITNQTKLKVDSTAVPSDGGSPILTYSLEIDDGKGGPFTVAYGDPVASLSLSFTTELLISRGLLYKVRSRAKNIIGWSSYSPTGYIRAAVRPNAPPAPAFVSATDNSITVSLKETIENGGATVTAYELYVDDGALGTFTKLTGYNGLAPSFKIDRTTGATEEKALVSGRVFRLKYKAINEINSSEFSDIVSVAMANAPAKPATPSKIISLSTSTTLVISWTAVANAALPGGVITKYKVFMDDGLDTGNVRGALEEYVQVQYVAASLTQVSVTGLTPGRPYKFKI